MSGKTVHTTWEVWTYDVWGNAVEGYEVNDRSCLHREYPLQLKVCVANAGTEGEFEYAAPTNAQIRQALDVGLVGIEMDGDDVYIIIDRASDGYPLGEMICTSHKSLSPLV